MQVAVKPYPACHFTHACADAAIALTREHRLTLESIRHVEALVPGEVVKTVCEPLANTRRPKNAYGAQFSIPYIVAAALLRGRFGLAELAPEAIADPEILALAERIDYRIDPRSGFPRYYSGELIITTADGRTLAHREHINRGCGDRPLAEHEILAKFHDNAGRAAAPERARAIAAAILGLDKAADMRAIAQLLSARRTQDQRASRVRRAHPRQPRALSRTRGQAACARARARRHLPRRDRRADEGARPVRRDDLDRLRRAWAGSGDLRADRRKSVAGMDVARRHFQLASDHGGGGRTFRHAGAKTGIPAALCQRRTARRRRPDRARLRHRPAGDPNHGAARGRVLCHQRHQDMDFERDLRADLCAARQDRSGGRAAPSRHEPVSCRERAGLHRRQEA